MYVLRMMQQNAFHHYFVIFEYKHNPMKKTFGIFLFVTMFVVRLSAQSIGPGVKKDNTQNALWLQNGAGEILANTKDTIDRDFFQIEQVRLQRLPPLKKGDRIKLVLLPVGMDGYFFIIDDNILPPKFLEAIKAAKNGGKMLFTIGGEENIAALSFIFK